MDAKGAKLINEQINHEFSSAYLYLDFANYYGSIGLDGFENWYRIQAMEERDHAMLFYQYLQNNGEKITFEAIRKPECTLTNSMDPLKAGFEHEKLVTSLINGIYAAAAGDLVLTEGENRDQLVIVAAGNGRQRQCQKHCHRRRCHKPHEYLSHGSQFLYYLPQTISIFVRYIAPLLLRSPMNL